MLPSSPWSSLVPWTRLDWPIAWETLFGRRAPLRVELGFGDGEFLERSALDEPEADWVGIELSWFSTRRLLRRVRERGIPNVRAVQGDGALVLEHLFPAGSLDAVVANHSDPWPKQRHQGRRLVQDRFLAVAAGRLRMGGRLSLATDHAEYADWIEEALRRCPSLRSVYPSGRVHEIPGRPSTRYERKGRAAGSIIHYFVWEKSDGESRWLPQEQRIGPMPNVLLQGTADFDRLLETWEAPLEDASRGRGVIRIQLLGAYRRSDRDEWLVEVRVDEDGFVQNLALSALRKDNARILLRPSPIGFPRPTPGLKRAVHLLAEEVLRRNPGLSVVTSGVGRLDSSGSNP